jgi:hypothetical protein
MYVQGQGLWIRVSIIFGKAGSGSVLRVKSWTWFRIQFKFRRLRAVLRSQKYFFRLRLPVAANPNFGSGFSSGPEYFYNFKMLFFYLSSRIKIVTT